MPTITIEVTEEQDKTIRRMAKNNGVSREQYAGNLLDKGLWAEGLQGQKGEETAPEDTGISPKRKRQKAPFRLKEKTDEARGDRTRVIATYNRQEWNGPDNDICRHIERQFWDVTSLIETMSETEIRKLQDNSPSTDQLVHPYSEHEGPHSVYVTDQIEMYWQETRNERLWE